jgi:phage-related protein
LTWRVEVLNRAVQSEIDAMPVDIRAKLAQIVELMVAVGPQNVRAPYVKPLREKLWEMRMRGRDNIARAIYVLVHEKRIVILHAFIKETQKTPPGAIALALRRAREIDA